MSFTWFVPSSAWATRKPILPPPAMKIRAHRVLKLAHLAHHGADILPGRDEKHLVVLEQARAALGRNLLAVPVDCRDAGLDARHMVPKGADFLAYQRPVPVRPDADQPHFAVSEIENLKSARVADQLLDVPRHQLLRADAEIHWHAVGAKQSRRVHVLGERTRAILVWVPNRV